MTLANQQFAGVTPSNQLDTFSVMAPQTDTPQGALPVPHDHIVGNVPAHDQGDYVIHLRAFCAIRGYRLGETAGYPATNRTTNRASSGAIAVGRDDADPAIGRVVPTEWVDTADDGYGESKLEQLHLTGAQDRLAAAGDLEFAEDAVGVGLDRADGDHQHPCDLGVGLAAGDQPQHLQLARAQPLAPWLVEGAPKADWDGRMSSILVPVPDGSSRPPGKAARSLAT